MGKLQKPWTLSVYLSPLIIYLVNASDGLQILLSYLLELYLLPSAFPISTVNGNKDAGITGLVSKEEHFRVGNYIIIALLGWILKPLLAYCTDTIPLTNWHSEASKEFSNGIKQRLPWLTVSSLITSCSAFMTAWVMHYDLVIVSKGAIVFLLMLCGIGLALSTSVAEAILFEKKRFNSTPEVAMGISLAMAVKVSSIAAALGFAVLLPIPFSKIAILMICIGLYCLCISLLSLFVEDNDFLLLGCGVDPSYLADSVPLSAQDEKIQMAQWSPIAGKRLLLWKQYIKSNGILPILALVLVLFATPDIRVWLQLAQLPNEDWSLRLNILYPVVVQLGKLFGVAMFQLGLYRFHYQRLASAATLVSIAVKFSGILLLSLSSFGIRLQSVFGGMDLLWIFILDAFVAAAAAELVFLAFLLIFCRHCPSGYEATAISIMLVTSQSGSFLTKLDSVWITSYISDSTSIHLIALQVLSVVFYVLSLLLFGMVAEPKTFRSDQPVFTVSSDPLEASSLLKFEDCIDEAVVQNDPLSPMRLPSSRSRGTVRVQSHKAAERNSNVTSSKFRSKDKAAANRSRRSVGDSKHWMMVDNAESCGYTYRNSSNAEIAKIDWSSVML